MYYASYRWFFSTIPSYSAARLLVTPAYRSVECRLGSLSLFSSLSLSLSLSLSQPHHELLASCSVGYCDGLNFYETFVIEMIQNIQRYPVYYRKRRTDSRFGLRILSSEMDSWYSVRSSHHYAKSLCIILYTRMSIELGSMKEPAPMQLNILNSWILIAG